MPQSGKPTGFDEHRATTDAVNGIRGAVEGFEPERAILCGSACVRIFVHRSEPAGQFVLEAEHSVGAVFKDILGSLNGRVLKQKPGLLRGLGLGLLVLLQPVIT